MRTYVICLDNQANPESLIIGKVYITLPDPDAEKAGMLRILDETYGEVGSEAGYLYPMKMFAVVTLPEAAKKVFEHVYS
jgi:hypothetical protein